MTETHVPYSVKNATRSRSRAGFWLVIIFLCLGIALSGFLNFILIGILASGDIGSSFSATKKNYGFQEKRLSGSGDTKVVRINVYGVITFSGSDSIFMKEEGMATRILKQIEVAEKDPDVKGILLVVDSPGGGVTASDIIYERLLTFKESEEDRKVIALFRDLAASGGYYIGVSADHIVAHRTTITGSIGVILSALNMAALGDKIGVQAVTITSGKNKDLLNPFKPVRTEQTNILQNTVNDLYERFVSVVARGRNMSAEVVRPLADGRIFTSPQAQELGLIDSIGYYDNAVEVMKEKLGVDEFTIVEYEKVHTFADLFSSRIAAAIELPVPPALRTSSRFQYLWEPALMVQP